MLLRITAVCTMQRYQCRTECQQQFKRPCTHCSLRIGTLIFCWALLQKLQENFFVKTGAPRKQAVLLLQMLFSSKMPNYFMSLTVQIYFFWLLPSFCIWGFWITHCVVVSCFQEWCEVYVKKLVCKEVACHFECYSRSVRASMWTFVYAESSVYVNN